MKKLYLLSILICLAKFSIGQLTVTTSTTNFTICAGSSSTITTSVTPNTIDPFTYTWSPSTGLNITAGSTLSHGAYLLGAYMTGEEPQTIQFIKQ